MKQLTDTEKQQLDAKIKEEQKTAAGTSGIESGHYRNLLKRHRQRQESSGSLRQGDSGNTVSSVSFFVCLSLA